jgi:ABC-type sugar transport system ATPase subunit/ribose/xylose/arabinose/galactoside ABC-type transport system permease subunit
MMNLRRGTAIDEPAPQAVRPEAPRWPGGAAALLGQLKAVPAAGLVGLLLVMWAVAAVAVPRFASGTNLLNILQQSSPLAIAAMGMTFVLLVAGIDLSVGSIYGLASVVLVTVLIDTGSVPLAVMAALVAGLVTGIVNGLVIEVVRIPPFIATLGMFYIALAVGEIISAGNALQMPSNSFLQSLGTAKPAGVPALIFVAAGVAVLAWVLLNRTQFGRAVVSVGFNREATRLSGARVRRVVASAFVISGLLAALSAILLTSQVSEGDPALGGSTATFQIIAAAVVGGTSLFGGRGTVLGTIVGAVIIETISNCITLLNINPDLYQAVLGSLVLIAIIIEVARVQFAGGRRYVAPSAVTLDMEAERAVSGAPVAGAVLSARHIQKSAYDEDGRPTRGSSVLLLSDANLEVRTGEIHALIGENGAGKTTLIKVLGGAIPHESGALEVHGELRRFGATAEARATGISVIWQELTVAPRLSVVENMFLGRELRRGPFLRKGEMVRQAAQSLAALGVSIDPHTTIARLSTAQQQVVEIAKALGERARVLILDEPTSSLSRVEVERLFSLLRRLRSEGIAIVLVTHRLDEVMEICDRTTVLKDGRNTGTFATAEVTRDQLIERMVGRELASNYPRSSAPTATPVLVSQDLHALGSPHGISIEVRAGEIVGLAGLVGAGRTEFARALVGAERASGGKVLLNGSDVSSWPMHRRLDAGMAYVPEDRKIQGVVLPLSIQRNLTMAAWDHLGPGPLVVPRRERAIATSLMNRLAVHARRVDQLVSTLSGGNQQRVAVGKWLERERILYVFDEPTRGIDVSARYALYQLMAGIAVRGGAILMISSDLPEILGMSDRVYVMREGAISGHFTRDQATETKVLERMVPMANASAARPTRHGHPEEGL